MKHTFGVLEVPTATRTSERNYSHAIIARNDYEAMERNARNHWKDCKTHRSNYNFDAGRATAKAGEMLFGYRFSFTQAEIDRSIAFIAKHPTYEEYLQHKLNECLLAISEKRRGRGDKFFVCGWSSSAQLAAKAIASHLYEAKDHKVVPTVILK